MIEYEVAITMTDVTSVDAESPEEALRIAHDIFEENGLTTGNYELDIIDEREL